MIHKSFSKQDLKDIIYDLSFNIPDYDMLNKHELIRKVSLYLENDNDIKFNNSELFPNKDLNYLKIYLNNQNPNKLLSVKEKNDILKLCKEIIHYCNTGYCIENTIFGSLEELKIHLSSIVKYGDIPSVRRCCRLIKGDIKINESFNPVISLKVRKELLLKKQNKIKNKRINNLIIRQGKFIVDFN